MSILTTNLYAIILAVLYTSSIYAMPFEIDFSIPWNISQSLPQLDFSETASFTRPSSINSDNIKETAASQTLSSHYGTGLRELFLFSAGNSHILNTRYESKHWLHDGVSTIGFNSADMFTPVTLSMRDFKPELSRDVVHFIDEKESLYFNVALYPAYAAPDIMPVSSMVRAKRTSASSILYSAGQLQSQAVPDPSPLWFVGLVLGLTGLVWRLFSIIRTVQ